MAYTGNPSSSNTDAVRLLVGDVSPTMPILGDDDYNYFLSQNGNNPKRAAVAAAQTILFMFSQLVEERIEMLEFKGGQAAANYREALKLFINNPNYSVAINGAIPYAGGISKTDIVANLDNADNQVVDITRSIASEGDINISYLDTDNPFNTNYGIRRGLFGDN